MKPFPSYRGTASFTLVELLVVIGILAILTAAVVIVLNPAELLKQSRDSKRITDMAAVDNALKILLTQTPEVSLGNASTVYVSLGDSSSTCGSYALPTLPSGWQYRCATSANLIKTDGSGWIPVNFANGASQLPALPVRMRRAAASPPAFPDPARRFWNRDRGAPMGSIGSCRDKRQAPCRRTAIWRIRAAAGRCCSRGGEASIARKHAGRI